MTAQSRTPSAESLLQAIGEYSGGDPDTPGHSYWIGSPAIVIGRARELDAPAVACDNDENRTPTLYGRTVIFAKDMAAECTSIHKESLDELLNRVDAYDTLRAQNAALKAALADLLAAVDAADKVKRGDFYHERKAARAALSQSQG